MSERIIDEILGKLKAQNTKDFDEFQKRRPLIHLCNHKNESDQLINIVSKMFEKLKSIASLGMVLEDKDERELNALHVCVMNNHEKIAEMILDECSKLVNEPGGSFQNYPIHFAAMNGSIELFEILESNGAQLDTSNANGQNILHLAALHQKNLFLEFIIENFDDDNNK